MNVARLRALDSWLGLPAAWAWGAWPRRRREPPANPERLLVIKLFGLGSVLTTAGVIAAFRREQPQCAVRLLTFSAHADLAELLEVYDDIACVRCHAPLPLLRDIWRAWRRLRAWRPDVAVDIEYFSKLSTLFGASLGARYRLGFLLPARWRRRLIDGGVAFREDIHFAECVARLLAPWGVDYRHLPYTKIRSSVGVEQTVAHLLNGDGALVPDTVRWVAVNPNAHDLCLERRWPPERFAELIDAFAAEDASLRFVLLGSAGERKHCEALRARLSPAGQSRSRNLAGKTSLLDVVAVLKHAALFVTNDSGLMHLGAAVGAPMVALFGPESPLRYRPLTDPDRLRLIQGDVACGPCLTFMNHKRAPCRGHNRCMQAIEVDRVVGACRELLRGTPT